MVVGEKALRPLISARRSLNRRGKLWAIILWRQLSGLEWKAYYDISTIIHCAKSSSSGHLREALCQVMLIRPTCIILLSGTNQPKALLLLATVVGIRKSVD